MREYVYVMNVIVKKLIFKSGVKYHKQQTVFGMNLKVACHRGWELNRLWESSRGAWMSQVTAWEEKINAIG